MTLKKAEILRETCKRKWFHSNQRIGTNTIILKIVQIYLMLLYTAQVFEYNVHNGARVILVYLICKCLYYLYILNFIYPIRIFCRFQTRNTMENRINSHESLGIFCILKLSFPLGYSNQKTKFVDSNKKKNQNYLILKHSTGIIFDIWSFGTVLNSIKWCVMQCLEHILIEWIQRVCLSCVWTRSKRKLQNKYIRKLYTNGNEKNASIQTHVFCILYFGILL